MVQLTHSVQGLKIEVSYSFGVKATYGERGYNRPQHGSGEGIGTIEYSGVVFPFKFKLPVCDDADQARRAIKSALKEWSGTVELGLKSGWTYVSSVELESNEPVCKATVKFVCENNRVSDFSIKGIPSVSIEHAERIARQIVNEALVKVHEYVDAPGVE